MIPAMLTSSVNAAFFSRGAFITTGRASATSRTLYRPSSAPIGASLGRTASTPPSQYGVPAYAAASFVAYTRVESGQHHDYDVIGGAAIGI